MATRTSDITVNIGMESMLRGMAPGSASEYLQNALLEGSFDPGYMRPFRGEDNKTYCDVLNQKTGQYERILTNSQSSLRFQDWRLIDEAVMRVAKPRLRVIGDLRAADLDVSLANGMAFTQFSFERISDISKAEINMDGIVKTETDRPVFDIVNLPLPIIHKDFSFPARQVMASRNGYSPLDTSTAELASRRVAEAAEELLLGVLPSFTYGGGTLYGLTNFPQRITYSMTAPTAGGWTPATLINQVLAMRLLSQLSFHYGPWMLYCSPNWDQYLDQDFSSAKGDNTLRERLRKIEGILDVRTVDYLQFLTNDPYTMILVQFTSDVLREVVGLDITTMQWESHGGMQMNFKVMCIMVPQMRADINNHTGVVHGSAASS